MWRRRQKKKRRASHFAEKSQPASFPARLNFERYISPRGAFAYTQSQNCCLTLGSRSAFSDKAVFTLLFSLFDTPFDDGLATETRDFAPFGVAPVDACGSLWGFGWLAWPRVVRTACTIATAADAARRRSVQPSPTKSPAASSPITRTLYGPATAKATAIGAA